MDLRAYHVEIGADPINRFQEFIVVTTSCLVAGDVALAEVRKTLGADSEQPKRMRVLSVAEYAHSVLIFPFEEGSGAPSGKAYFATYLHLLVDLHLARYRGDEERARALGDLLDEAVSHLDGDQLDRAKGLSADLHDVFGGAGATLIGGAG